MISSSTACVATTPTRACRPRTSTPSPNCKPKSLYDFDRRIDAIGIFAQLPEAAALAAANKRIGNILKKVEGEIPQHRRPHPAARARPNCALAEAVEAVYGDTGHALAHGDYVGRAGPPGAAAPAGRRVLRQRDGQRRRRGPARQPPGPAEAAGRPPGQRGGDRASVELISPLVIPAPAGTTAPDPSALTRHRYPAPMRLSPPRLLLALACCLATSPALAAKVTKVDINGLADEAMEDNVRGALSLSDELDKDISARRLNYLLRQAEKETREALEPFGYYSPVITVKRSDRERAVGEPAPERTGAAGDSANPAADADVDNAIARDGQATPPQGGERARDDRVLSVSIHVELGEPVRVRRLDVGVEGRKAGCDRRCRAGRIRAARGRGARPSRCTRPASRGSAGALAEHGYFDAELRRAPGRSHARRTRGRHRPALDQRRALRAGRGDLRAGTEPGDPRPACWKSWWTGTKAIPTTRPSWNACGDSLTSLDYFGAGRRHREARGRTRQDRADQRRPDPGQAQHLQRRPELRHRQRLRRARRRRAPLPQFPRPQGAGPAGLRGASARCVTLQYRMPAFAWLDGWYTASLQAVDEQTDYIDNRRLELVGSRSGRYQRTPEPGRLAARPARALGVQRRRRWRRRARADRLHATRASVTRRCAREYVDVDDRLDPRRGAGGTLTLRGGEGGAGSRRDLRADCMPSALVPRLRCRQHS